LGYGNRQPWKTTFEVHGTTHPSRSRKRKLEDDDSGRAPDTTKKLVKEERATASNDQLNKSAKIPDIQSVNQQISKANLPKPSKPLKPLEFMKADLYVNDLRLFRDLSLQGYPHNGSSSCYFDSCLEALFFCSLHLNSRFDVNSSVSSKMRLVVDHTIDRKSIYESAQTIPEIQQRLYDLRDELASDLKLDLTKFNNPIV